MDKEKTIKRLKALSDEDLEWLVKEASNEDRWRHSISNPANPRRHLYISRESAAEKAGFGSMCGHDDLEYDY